MGNSYSQPELTATAKKIDTRGVTAPSIPGKTERGVARLVDEGLRWIRVAFDAESPDTAFCRGVSVVWPECTRGTAR